MISGEPPNIPKGSIILAWFPYTDFSDEKLRPALVLYEGYLDVTVAYISSQIPAKPLDSDLLILPGTSSYECARLKEPSVLCIDKIMIIDKQRMGDKKSIEGIMGEADDNLKRDVNAKIIQCLTFSDISTNLE